ncbi:hypothetical protein NLO88_17930 [Pseudomonas syringae]|nr:hypothetical protein [Pseudomonas syringae]
MTTGATNTQVIRDLVGISSDLKWSSVELSRIADRLEAAGNSADAQAILRMIQVFQDGEKRLALIANTVKSGAVGFPSEERLYVER